MKFPRLWSIPAGAICGIFWVLTVAVPVGAVLTRVQRWSDLSDETILQVVQMTVWQSGMSTVISMAGGLLLGLWLGSFSQGRWTRWAELGLAIPFGTPTLVVALSWVAWLGRSSLNYSLAAVVIAHVFLNIPLVALSVAYARRYVSPAALEAAESLGASYNVRFREIIWPEVWSGFLSSGAQVAALCSMSFALVMILGGGPPVETLETALYSRVRAGVVDLSGAAACAIWQLVVTLTPWLIVLMLRRRRPRAAQVDARPARDVARIWKGLLLLVCWIFTLPYLILLRSKPWSLVIDAHLWSQIARPLRWSLLIAAGTSTLAVGIAVCAIGALSSGARSPGLRRLAAFLLGLPSGISVLVLGLGVWFAYGRWLDPFEGSVTAILVLQATIFFPVALRMLWPLTERANVREWEAAENLGARPFQAFVTVEWPRWRSPLLASLTLVAGAALGEVAAVSLFYSENLIPLPLLISRWQAQYRFEDAQAVATLLFLVSAITMVLSFRFKNSNERLHA